MDPITRLSGRALPLPISNINTDAVTPARFLKMVGKDQARLAEALFYDWRFNPDGTPRPDFPMNQPRHSGATIILARDNFGCGSSREKAPWAIVAAGFRAVIATSFADIFRNNALKNGLLPIVVDGATSEKLFAAVAEEPTTELTVDLAAQTLQWAATESAHFPIDPFAKTCLLRGLDQRAYILQFDAQIAAFEARHSQPPSRG